MPRRKDSFAAALADAQKRLAKAKTERADATARLVELDAEIPRLQQIIASFNPVPLSPHMQIVIETPMDDSHALQTTEAKISPDLAKQLAAKATGPIRGGSIPYGGVKPTVSAPVSEDETLPEPEGEEII